MDVFDTILTVLGPLGDKILADLWFRFSRTRDAWMASTKMSTTPCTATPTCICSGGGTTKERHPAVDASAHESHRNMYLHMSVAARMVRLVKAIEENTEPVGKRALLPPRGTQDDVVWPA